MVNYVFTLTGTDLASNRVVSGMFSSSENTSPPRQIKLAEWNLSMVLRSFTSPLYEPMKLSSDKHSIWKTCFFLALTSAIMIS